MSNDSLPDDLMCLFNNPFVSPDQSVLIERIHTDIGDLKRSNLIIKKHLHRQNRSNIKFEKKLHKQEQSIIKIEESISRQEQSNVQILNMLTQLLQSNNRDDDRFISSKINNPEVRLSVTEGSITRSNSTITIPTISKVNQRHTTSESNINTVEENRNQLGLTTTNELNSNGQLLYASDEIDKLRSEKNQKKNQIGESCHEINVGAVDNASSLIAAPDREITQPERTERLEINQITSTQNLINPQILSQLSNTEPIVTITGMYLLHPLEEQINSKTDNNRYTLLKDCFGNTPVLCVHGDNLPEIISIDMAMIFSSKKGLYYSMYQFLEEGIKKESIYRSSKTNNNNKSQSIELDNLKIIKMCNLTKKNGQTYILKEYPSGDLKDSMIAGAKDLNKKYNCKHVQLVIRCFGNLFFYSNLLHGVSKVQSTQYNLQISTIYPTENRISFDCNNQCQMKFSIKIPQPFHCTLISGYKWLEISLVTNDNLNFMYSIDIGNNGINNPIYIQIRYDSFEIPLKIIKQILNTNKFCVQFRILHSEIAPPQPPIEYYRNCEPEKSEEFEEDFTDIDSSQEQETVRNIGQKRTTCDDNLRLPICKARKTCNEYLYS